jgi:hypothetical protein
MLTQAEHIPCTQLKPIMQYVPVCNYIRITFSQDEGSSFALLSIINQRRTAEQINICMRSIVSVNLDMPE